jgi:catechol 2,3-dioxygenase-like lactoylglutathione lyase family enzyme
MVLAMLRFLEARGIEHAPLFGDVSNPHFRIGRYLRPIDLLSCFWSDEVAADGGSCERCDRCTLLPADTVSRLESSMSSVEIEQKAYEMPPREGISIAYFLTVADLDRSAHYYEKVFGARILTMGDGNAPPYLQLANIWMILNVGGGPTPDKPTVTLSVPDPNQINSFMNFRVADIQACYELWKSRGAEFITPPIPKYGEIRCYIRDPDGYIIEVGQSTDLTYG